MPLYYILHTWKFYYSKLFFNANTTRNKFNNRSLKLYSKYYVEYSNSNLIGHLDIQNELHLSKILYIKLVVVVA